MVDRQFATAKVLFLHSRFIKPSVSAKVSDRHSVGMASVNENETVMDRQALSRNRPVVVIYTANNDTVIQQLKERHSDIPYVLVDVQPPGSYRQSFANVTV